MSSSDLTGGGSNTECVLRKREFILLKVTEFKPIIFHKHTKLLLWSSYDLQTSGRSTECPFVPTERGFIKCKKVTKRKGETF
jgi:hypothetical protein